MFFHYPIPLLASLLSARDVKPLTSTAAPQAIKDSVLYSRPGQCFDMSPHGLGMHGLGPSPLPRKPVSDPIRYPDSDLSSQITLHLAADLQKQDPAARDAELAPSLPSSWLSRYRRESRSSGVTHRMTALSETDTLSIGCIAL